MKYILFKKKFYHFNPGEIRSTGDDVDGFGFSTYDNHNKPQYYSFDRLINSGVIDISDDLFVLRCLTIILEDVMFK